MTDLKKIKRILSKKKKIACNKSFGNNSKSWKCLKCEQVFSYNNKFWHNCENYKRQKFKNLVNNK